MKSQSLSKYHWENRLVVVLTKSPENEIVQNQVQIFSEELQAFEDRKLVLIHICPEKMQVLLPKKYDWEDSDSYQKLKKSSNEMEVLLIGLDGDIKLRQSKILDTPKLFALIDSMPMRKAEMRKNQ